MSDACCDPDPKRDVKVASGTAPSTGSEEKETLDLTFDTSVNSTQPSLRRPQLSNAELLVALELGFSGKYLPSSVTGGESNSTQQGNTSSQDNKPNKPTPPAASMFNNSNSNSGTNTNQVSGSQNQYPLFVDNYSYNLTSEQQEGLLAPLRRPDINQLPPDVLAILLKSSRFEEILIPTQRRLTTEPSSNSSFSAQSQPQQAAQPRPPNTDPAPDVIPTSVSTPINTKSSGASRGSNTAQSQQSTSTSPKSALSPFAREFVPQSPAAEMSSSRDANDLAYAISQVEVQDQYESFNLVEELDGSDCILSTVTDMISQVSQNPATLTRCAKVTVDVLKKHLNDEDTLGIVVTLLVEQMISNPNFSYSGAKILETLRENEIAVGDKKDILKPLVLTRMHDEFNNCLKNLEDPEVRSRSLGVLRLLSEIYMNFGLLPNSSKLNILALAILELMQELIKKDKSIEVIKCVCQLLKLIGWDLDNSKNEKVLELLEGVLKELSFIRMSSEGKQHPSCEALVDMIFKLRSTKWNREQPEPQPTSTSTPPQRQQQQETLYYELPDSDDDWEGDDGAIMIDDEPDEVQAAYEEFLKMSSKNSKNANS